MASFAEKAAARVDGEPLYPDPLRDITDQIGVRVITYVHSDVTAVADLLGDQVVVHRRPRHGPGDRQRGPVRLRQPAPADRRRRRPGEPGGVRAAAGRSAQVQIRTVLQHAWAEFEHDIRYKGTIPDEHARDFDRRFTLAAGLLELADQEFSAIRDRLRPRSTRARAEHRRRRPADRARASWRRSWPGSTPTPAGRAPTTTPGSPGCCSSSASPPSTSSARCCAPVDEAAIAARMGYRYPPGAVRRLDDALLAAFGERYVGLHGNAHRVPALRARLQRLRPEPDGT